MAWEESSVIEREIKRIKVVLSKNIYTELLAQIDKANKELREITHQNRYLESVRQKRRSQRSMVDFKRVRRHAESLYNVIVTGRSWRCRCREDHVANLRLEARPLEHINDNVASNPKLRFRILLSKPKSPAKPEILCRWHELEVEPLEDVPTHPHVLTHSDGQNSRKDFSSHHSKK